MTNVNVTASHSPTITDFMRNPHRPGSVIPGGVSAMRLTLERQYTDLKALFPDLFKLSLFRGNTASQRIFILSFPSASRMDSPAAEQHIYYSMLIVPRQPTQANDLKDISFTFATSYPAWYFSQAWLFYHTGMIVPELLELYRGALAKQPVSRNPAGLRMWDISSYFIIHHLCKITGLIYAPEVRFQKFPGFTPALKKLMAPKLGS